jgi:hypothetical protein
MSAFCRYTRGLKLLRALGMDSIDLNLGMSSEIYAMKKAMETQDQGFAKFLDNTQQSSTADSFSSSSSIGLGQTIDIRG